MYTPLLNDLLEFEGFDIGLDDYDIWGADATEREANREKLNSKIIDRYRFRQIGLETADRFVWAINEAMTRIMPSYCELYKNTRDAVLGDTKSRKTIAGARTTNNTKGQQTNSVTNSNTENYSDTANGSNTRNSADVQSNTPQNSMSLDLDSFTGYASAINKSVISDSNNSHSESISSNSGSSQTVEGSRSDSSITQSYTDTDTESTTLGWVSLADKKIIADIEQMIIEDENINECFMLIY